MLKKNNLNQSFGLLFFALFLIISLWPLLYGKDIRIWSLGISLVFLILGILNSKLLNPLRLLWIKLGDFLGKIIAPVVMGIIFFFILTPIGLLMRIFGKDFLRVKYSKHKTYWLKKDKPLGSMKKQF